VDHDIILDVLRAFEREAVRYKVVGAVALNFLGLARATRDLDIFVAADEDNIDRLKRALHSVFHDPSIDEISHLDLAGDYPAVQYVPPEGTFHIDILHRLGEAFSFAGIETEIQSVEGLQVPVATAAMLFRMKKDTVRLQDKADAERLRQRYQLEE
jgi:hypothetical protein